MFKKEEMKAIYESMNLKEESKEVFNESIGGDYLNELEDVSDDVKPMASDYAEVDQGEDVSLEEGTIDYGQFGGPNKNIIGGLVRMVQEQGNDTQSFANQLVQIIQVVIKNTNLDLSETKTYINKFLDIDQNLAEDSTPDPTDEEIRDANDEEYHVKRDTDKPINTSEDRENQIQAQKLGKKLIYDD